jgi:hypothetical protein
VPVNDDLMAHFFKSQGKLLNRCLSPDMSCTEKAIKAHSVQNAGVLDLLSTDGHVIHFNLHASGNSPPELNYKKIGRNKATTFTGLCGKHDQEIFREIDAKPIDIENQSQLLLLAYRSVLRELHATMDGAIKIQEAYQKRVKLGLDPENQPSHACIEATYQLAKAWRTFWYRCRYDDIRQSSNYAKLVHRVREINVQQPTIAASAFLA